MKQIILIVLVSFFSYDAFCQVPDYGTDIKYAVIKNSIDRVGKLEKIDLQNKDTLTELEIIVDYMYSDLESHGDGADGSGDIEVLTKARIDSLTFNSLKKAYETPFVGLYDIDGYLTILNNVNRNYDRTLINKKYYTISNYNVIIVGKPINLGWGALDILGYLTDTTVYNKNQYTKAYLHPYDKYKSFVLHIPVTVLKKNLKNHKEDITKQYLIEYHIYSDKGFNTIKYKFNKIISLGCVWK